VAQLSKSVNSPSELVLSLRNLNFWVTSALHILIIVYYLAHLRLKRLQFPAHFEKEKRVELLRRYLLPLVLEILLCSIYSPPDWIASAISSFIGSLFTLEQEMTDFGAKPREILV